MKKLFQSLQMTSPKVCCRVVHFIKSDWKFLVVVIFLVFATYEIIQMNRMVRSINRSVGSIETDVGSIQSDVGSIKFAVDSIESDGVSIRR